MIGDADAIASLIIFLKNQMSKAERLSARKDWNASS